jgi:starch synthase
MRILFATPELIPYSKTGGLADVASALPAALARRGHEVTVITPRYAHVDVATWDLRRKRFRLIVPIHGKAIQGGLLEGTSPEGFQVLFVDQPGYFERPGLYAENGKDYPDNDERFAFFCHAVLESCKLMGMRPQVIHLNDWQTGPVAPLLQSLYRDRPELNTTGTLFTIHNLAYQGLFSPDSMMALGLDWQYFTPSNLEYYGKVSYIKSGLVFSDKLTTVSPTYAREIRTPEWGCGLDGLLKERADDLRGILNGVDYRIWNPSSDEHLSSSYSADDLSGKTVCKSDLQRRTGLPQNHDAALIGSVSRLTSQKGIDLFLDAADDLLKLNCQFIFLGEGEPELEAQLRQLADRFPHRLAFIPGYDEAMAHRIEAGADIFLMPSRYEPCGLNQIYSLRYGTIPIVRAVGGLQDAIDDVDDEEGNGFKFKGETGEALLATVKRALALYENRVAWRRLMENAMEMEFTWDLPARRYETLYREVIALRA